MGPPGMLCDALPTLGKCRTDALVKALITRRSRGHRCAAVDFVSPVLGCGRIHVVTENREDPSEVANAVLEVVRTVSPTVTLERTHGFGIPVIHVVLDPDPERTCECAHANSGSPAGSPDSN